MVENGKVRERQTATLEERAFKGEVFQESDTYDILPFVFHEGIKTFE